MLKINIGIVIGIAVLGLLFYWRKKRKKVKSQMMQKQGVDMEQYGVQVMDKTGNLISITDRPIMISDVLYIPYGKNGDRSFNTPIHSVAVDIDYEIDPASDGKAIYVTYAGNKVVWNWVSVKALKPSDAKVIVFS